jgi:hypothetical protein
MKEFSARVTINAPAETIWGLLTDAAGYPNWDPGMIRLEGTVAPGEKITAYTKISPDRAFPVTVSHFVPKQAMTWSSGMPLGLFKGERTFTLTPQADGTVDFFVREQFTGLLMPLIGRTIPDLSQSFTDFAEGLKAKAESL